MEAGSSKNLIVLPPLQQAPTPITILSSNFLPHPVTGVKNVNKVPKLGHSTIIGSTLQCTLQSS